jgi:hypothetical protein
VRDGADQFRRGAARKLRVGVQGENIANLARSFETAGFDGERVEVADEELVQIQEFASLAFPAHPHALSCVEDATAMEKEEGAAFGRGVFGVEFVDKLDGKFDKRVRVVFVRFAYESPASQ